MKTLVNVARYHLVNRIAYVALPWAILAFSFLVNLAIAAMAPQQPGGMYTGDWSASTFSCSLRCAEHDRGTAVPTDAGLSRRSYYPAPPCSCWRSAPRPGADRVKARERESSGGASHCTTSGCRGP